MRLGPQFCVAMQWYLQSEMYPYWQHLIGRRWATVRWCCYTMWKDRQSLHRQTLQSLTPISALLNVKHVAWCYNKHMWSIKQGNPSGTMTKDSDINNQSKGVSKTSNCWASKLMLRGNSLHFQLHCGTGKGMLLSRYNLQRSDFEWSPIVIKIKQAKQMTSWWSKHPRKKLQPKWKCKKQWKATKVHVQSNVYYFKLKH